MAHQWQLRCRPPRTLTKPTQVGASGGPTASAARFANWRQVGRGLYVPAQTDSTVVEQRILEASCQVPGAVVTGWAALRLHGSNLCDGLAADGRTLLDVPLTGRQSSRAHPGITYSRASLRPGEIVERQGMRCTTALRATVDAMLGAADLRAAVVIGDIACSSRLVDTVALTADLHSRSHQRGLSIARRAVALVSDRSRSPAEPRLRLIWVIDAGLPEPLCNWPILDADGQWLGAPDLVSPENGVYGEFDGRDHRDIGQHATDVTRDTTFLDLGLEGFRVVGRDLHDIDLVVGRIRSAIHRAQQSRRPRLWRLGNRPSPLVR